MATQPVNEIQPTTEEIIASQQATIARLMAELESALAENVRLAASALAEHSRTKKLEDERDEARAIRDEDQSSIHRINRHKISHLEILGEILSQSQPNMPELPRPWRSVIERHINAALEELSTCPSPR